MNLNGYYSVATLKYNAADKEINFNSILYRLLHIYYLSEYMAIGYTWEQCLMSSCHTNFRIYPSAIKFVSKCLFWYCNAISSQVKNKCLSKFILPHQILFLLNMKR